MRVVAILRPQRIIPQKQLKDWSSEEEVEEVYVPRSTTRRSMRTSPLPKTVAVPVEALPSPR